MGHERRRILWNLDAIAATDVTPLALDTNSIVWQVLLYWIGQTVGGAEGINGLTVGDRNFSDPELVEIVTNWQRLADYTIPGAETMEGSETFQLFAEEQSAMITGGFGTIDNAREVFGDNLGMVRMPDYSADAPITGGGIGGPGVAFIVSNYSANKDAAYALVKFLESPEELTLRAESGEGHLVNLADVDATALYDDPFKVVAAGMGRRAQHDLLARQYLPGRAHHRDQGPVAVGLDRRDQRRGVHGAGRRQAGRVAWPLIRRPGMATGDGAMAATESGQKIERRSGPIASGVPRGVGPSAHGARCAAAKPSPDWLSMLPAIALVGFVIWYPVARTFQYSFTDWNGASATWVGLDNYTDFLTGSDFWTPLRNNAIFLLAIPGILLLSLVVSVLLFEQVPGWRFFRSVYYLPTILSAAVVGMLMRAMFNSRGVVNSLLDTIGLESLTRNWLGICANGVHRPHHRLLLANAWPGRADLPGRPQRDSR